MDAALVATQPYKRATRAFEDGLLSEEEHVQARTNAEVADARAERARLRLSWIRVRSPLSGVVTRRDIVDDFASKDDYFNTFGGNPVSCAAGLAVLDVLDEERLQQNALEVGQYLVDGLSSLAERHEVIGDVRGSGFFIGLELVNDREKKTPATELAKRIVNELRDRGLLTGTIGPDANILKLRCPMVLNRDDADYALEIIDVSLSAVTD